MLKFKKQEGQPYDNTNAPRITKNGSYVAEVVKIEEFKSEAHPDWDTSLKFIFRVIETEFFGGFASGLVSQNWNPGNKFDNWLIALGVETSNIGDVLSSEQLKGQIAKVRIEISPGKDGKPGFANVKGLEKMHTVDFQRISPNHKKRVTGAKAPEASATPATPSSVAPAPIEPVDTPAPVQLPVAPIVPAPVAPVPVVPAPMPVPQPVIVPQPVTPVQDPVQPEPTPAPAPQAAPPAITGDDVPF